MLCYSGMTSPVVHTRQRRSNTMLNPRSNWRAGVLGRFFLNYRNINMIKIKNGDVVCLRSGSPQMTVCSSGEDREGIQCAVCIWYDYKSESVKREYVPVVILDHYVDKFKDCDTEKSVCYSGMTYPCPKLPSVDSVDESAWQEYKDKVKIQTLEDLKLQIMAENPQVLGVTDQVLESTKSYYADKKERVRFADDIRYFKKKSEKNYTNLGFSNAWLKPSTDLEKFELQEKADNDFIERLKELDG